jgi:hypothetical protein
MKPSALFEALHALIDQRVPPPYLGRLRRRQMTDRRPSGE